ncbi:hypothetical protein Cylst_0964 [Cylindrospermum stagnale PCC 7417]|uniref:Uncharacterized protein n=1 Tax=Cylindrospermum stagnale PCC 7417 TaxID=56107 RepID=K9WSU6_9NOST|nr:hypothetical protein [Cylindrospermum stagnale]AFZ23288.1 hypothetical protein Cylst_0964 [Cylindrospermum stagnale PCC 7417]
MAAIQLSELRLAGYDLLQDSESFLDELASEEIQNIVGGHYSHGRSYYDRSHHDYSHGYSKHGGWY